MTDTVVTRRILTEQEPSRLSILEPAGTPVGSLVPVTRSVIQNDEIIGKLTAWRNQAGRYFLTQFTATPERTKRWLESTVVTDPTRLLFLIYASTGRMVGYVGFTKLTSQDAEFGPLLRGESGGHPSLITYAETTLIEWIFRTLQLERLYAIVFTTNPIPLHLHEAVGFQRTDLIPMERTIVNGETHLILGQAGASSPHGLYAQKVVLERERFYGRRLEESAT